ncbi:MAG: hypothetical protein QOD56_2944, partial [Gammaproteobacteria bacterium]|nr:hypothetical protein [Gammaproteobacteria bacterium]
FLKYGSQDHFTIFSGFYATAVQWFGVESAAAILTLVSQCALLGAAWALARAIMPGSMALLGAFVLFAIPGDYGSDRIFTCFESFLTPRMAAEALTLGGLAAAMTHRRLWAAMLLVLAALIHPVMAAAGFAALFYRYVGVPRPRLALLLAAGLVLVFLAAFAIWGRFDDAWLALIKDRSPYLFLSHWRPDDWSRAAVTMATLIVGGRVLPNAAARQLSWIALWTLVSGLALTAIACDSLHLVLFTRAQPWRWQWFGTAVAALVLPATVRGLWQSTGAGRTTSLLLVAAWLFASNAYALAAAVSALASLVLMHRLKPNEARLVFWGSCGMLAIAIVWRAASNLQFTEAYYLDPSIPLWIRRTMSFTRDGAAPVAIIWLMWRCAQSRRGYPVLILMGALAFAGCAVLVPQTWRSWTTREFAQQAIDRFAPFREHIPPASDVFWPESPTAAWVLLDRPSYLSVVQTSGMVFSRQSAFELSRRATALDSTLPRGTFMNWNSGGTGMNLSKQQLEQACRTGEFGFLVTAVDLGVEPVAVVPSTSGAPSKKIRLYTCRAGSS